MWPSNLILSNPVFPFISSPSVTNLAAVELFSYAISNFPRCSKIVTSLIKLEVNLI
ncbi:hypothetical protein SCITRI_001509 [Spiroplasma citri]|nr:hypothetical protein SCITRI_001509 [Spiroplasma citri]